MTRYTPSLGFRGKSAARGRVRSRLLRSLIIATAIAANAASCRDFDTSDAPVSAGTSGAGTSGAGLGGNNAFSDTGGQVADAGVGGGSAELRGGGGQGGVDAVTMAWTSGDGGTSGARATEIDVSPSALSGLVLWLESNDASFDSNGSRVSKWKDSSKHGNDASEPETALQPRLVTNALNGFSAVKFDGTPSNLIVSDDSSLQVGTESFTVAFVGEWHNDPTPTSAYPGYGFILTKALTSEPYDGIAISANIAAPFGTVKAQRRLGLQLEIGTAAVPSRANDLNDSRFRLYLVRRNGPGLIEQRINGTEQNSADIPPNIDASAAGQSLFLGGNLYNHFDGSLAELVMVKGALSESELHGLEKYLMTKFGL